MLPHEYATSRDKEPTGDPGKQHPKVLSHLHPRETDTSKTPVAGLTGSPEKILRDTEHKSKRHTQPGEEAERGVYSLLCSSGSQAAGFQQNAKLGKSNPKQEEK